MYYITKEKKELIKACPEDSVSLSFDFLKKYIEQEDWAVLDRCLLKSLNDLFDLGVLTIKPTHVLSGWEHSKLSGDKFSTLMLFDK